MKNTTFIFLILQNTQDKKGKKKPDTAKKGKDDSKYTMHTLVQYNRYLILKWCK